MIEFVSQKQPACVDIKVLYMRRRKCEKKCKTIFNQNKHRHLVGRDVSVYGKKIDSSTQLKYLYSENERRAKAHICFPFVKDIWTYLPVVILLLYILSLFIVSASNESLL